LRATKGTQTVFGWRGGRGGLVGAGAGWAWRGVGWFVERDAELDGHVPAGDADLVDD